MTSGTSSKTFVHEVGHHFGLLHTFHPNKTYKVPVLDAQPDHPYPVLIPNSTTDYQPWWWGRELVIRENQPNKSFEASNHAAAGDLVMDTPADCAEYPTLFPGCPQTAQDITTCEFNSTLTYTDYNGDAIYPPPAGLSLGRNYMSYWRDTCKNEFTPKQIDRIIYYYETARKPLHALDKCDNFTDKVEFEGSNLGLHNVTARIRHFFDTRICNVTTDREGNFSGILHADGLSAHVYHNGQKNTLANLNDPLRIHYDHTPCEWLRGVSTFDLLLINRHIIGLQPLPSGYSMIAADANKNNAITAFDIVELRKLILGIYDKLPAHEQPWRYIPEFIPQEHPISFDSNPFNVPAGDGNDYLGQGWTFTLTSAQSGKKGFDGIKIGDVNSSWPISPECPNESQTPEDAGEKPAFTVPTTSLTQNQVVALTIRANNFQQLEAYQLGIRLPFEYFEVQDVTNTSLPSYTKADNFGLTKLEENAVRNSWFDESGGSQTLPNNSTLFSLVVRAKQPISNLQSVLKLDNSILPNEIWRTGVVTEPVSLTVSVEEVEERADDEAPKSLMKDSDGLLRCYPNPFANNIQLTFVHLGESAQGDLRITNANGAETHRQVLSIVPGENTVAITSLKDAPVGIYWVSLKVNGKTHAAKLVKE